MARRRSDHNRLSGILEAVSHKATLKRGYALIRDAAGSPLFAAAGIVEGDRLDVEFHDGHVQVVAGSSSDTPAPSRTRRRGPRSQDGPDQGSLF
jgi:exodeoxyribonuclease VII large subunit